MNAVLFERNTEFYNRISIAKGTLADEILTLLAMETMSARPIKEKVAMTTAVVPHAGVKTVKPSTGDVPLPEARRSLSGGRSSCECPG